MNIDVMLPEQYAGYLQSKKDAGGGATPRVQSLVLSIRESMGRPKTYWNEPDSVLDEETAKLPLIVRKAMAVKRKLETVPVGLWDKQLIAGSFVLPDKDISLSGSLPRYATDEEIRKASENGIGVWTIVGHIVPDYPRLLRLGASGIMHMAREKLSKGPQKDSADFYKAVIIVMEGLVDFARRYADKCECAAWKIDNCERRRELLDMAARLRHSPLYPPQTFHQALQTIWITHLAFQLTGNALAIGRIDQHVEHFLNRDLELGRINVDQAQELMDCFFLKFNERAVDNRIVLENTDVQKVQERNLKNWANRSPFDHSTQKTNVRDSIDASNHWLQNVILGGVKPADGSDATGLATVMCLESFRRNGMTNPCITLRLHKNTPQYLVEFAAQVLMTGGGLPALFNDDAIIPALLKSGFPPEDARDYTNDGCWEVIVAGRTDFYFDRFNMLKCLEWALNHGCSRVDGKKEAPDLGDPRSFDTYEKVLDGFKKMLDYELEGIIRKLDGNFGNRAMIAPVPLLSALLEGPLEKGMDMTAGGAKYITYGLIAEGVSHLIDSLAAIKKVIFEEKKASMDQLIEALNNNFEGFELLRQQLMKAPKYGNNDPYADSIGQEVIEYFAEKVRELNRIYGKIKYLPGAGTFSWYIAIGEGTGPSPDGRLCAQAVSSNLSPSIGAARRGVTGAILSHSKMRMEDLPVGSPNDLRIARKMVEGEEGMKRLTGIIRSFVELGGNMLTLTIADSAELREAQREPDKHRDLRVRMGGWSAYFTMLSKEQQDHHIAKQEEI